jgi:hypothetical protein
MHRMPKHHVLYAAVHHVQNASTFRQYFPAAWGCDPYHVHVPNVTTPKLHGGGFWHLTTKTARAAMPWLLQTVQVQSSAFVSASIQAKLVQHFYTILVLNASTCKVHRGGIWP